MNMVFCRACGKEIEESATVCPLCGAQQGNTAAPAAGGHKSQTIAALLAAFLGSFGAHRFYLGPIWLAVVYLLLCWTGIPGLVASVEMFIIVFSSQETWARKYNNGVITAPVHIVVKILVLVLPAILIIGIMFGVAIPAYQDYISKARSVGPRTEVPTTQIRVAARQARPDGNRPCWNNPAMAKADRVRVGLIPSA